MKKSLLFAAVALLAVSAGNAQMKRSDMKVKKLDNVERTTAMPKTKMVEAKMNDGKRVLASQLTPKDNVKAWYNRPAGAFYYDILLDDEDGKFYSFYAPFVVMKPYEEYTWKNASEGADSYQWLVQMYVNNGAGWARQWLDTDETDLVTAYGWESDTVPKLSAYATGGSNTYQLFHNEVKKSLLGTKVTTYISHLAAAPTMSASFGGRMWGASHYCGVRNREDESSYASYYGEHLHPHGTNEHGLWFGKNDDGLDAYCQIFEKPEHPYALLSVATPGGLTVAAEGGQLTANVYKLKVDHPQYQADASVVLTPDDLELLSSTTIDIDTAMANDYMLIFPIMETVEIEGEQLSFESSLHIDFPIMVEITGYNGEITGIDQEAGKLIVADNGILDFSGAVTTDENDEGFGEMAFLKRYKWYDEEGNILDEPYYQYEGICNFFQNSADMKCGFDIFIETENPFMTFNYNGEDGEYEFPAEGGSFSKTFGEGPDAVTTDAIQIFSWYPSEDWDIFTADGEDVPDWLTLEPEDQIEMDEETGEEEFSNLVYVKAEAEPLPEGVKGRECTVRFSVVGADLLYHFTQGDTSGSGLLVGDVNRDGRVNVSDVSALINMILGITEKDMETADVNGDGKVNVSDVSALINIILGITA